MCPRLTILLMSLLAVIQTSAETFETQNGLTIHYSIVPTLMLSKNIANQYQIVRAKDRSILNIAIKDQSGSSIKASIAGKKENLLGQREKLSFSEFSEGDAIYYVAAIKHGKEELLRFSTEIQPPNKKSETLRFTKKLYLGEE